MSRRTKADASRGARAKRKVISERDEVRGLYTIPAIYDALHQPGTKGEVKAIIRLARRFHPPAALRGALWLEPACGTARHLREAFARGFDIAGFDTERTMLSFARAHCPGAPRHAFFNGRMEDFVLPRAFGSRKADLAFNLINSIRHLSSDRAMLEHLRSVADALNPGGIYVVGIGMAAYGVETDTEDVWRGSAGTLRVTQVVQYIPATSRTGVGRSERVISHLTVRDGTRERHIDSHYTLRSFDLAQWRATIARSPFSVVGVADQDGHPTRAVEPGYALWVLRRS